jgi:hypothetical protein
VWTVWTWSIRLAAPRRDRPGSHEMRAPGHAITAVVINSVAATVNVVRSPGCDAKEQRRERLRRKVAAGQARARVRWSSARVLVAGPASGTDCRSAPSAMRIPNSCVRDPTSTQLTRTSRWPTAPAQEGTPQRHRLYSRGEAEACFRISSRLAASYAATCGSTPARRCARAVTLAACAVRSHEKTRLARKPLGNREVERLLNVAGGTLARIRDHAMISRSFHRDHWSRWPIAVVFGKCARAKTPGSR